LSDEELMKLYLSGETSAFEELYRRHASKVYATLSRKIDRKQVVDELHQAVFLKFHQSRHRFDYKHPVLQWLFVITRTTLIDYYRKQGRQVKETDDVLPEQIAAQASESEPISETLAAIDALSPEQKQAIEWKYLNDLSYEEISHRLKRSQMSVRQLVSRALKHMRTSLQAKGKGPQS